jgi:PAS domain-containing protein
MSNSKSFWKKTLSFLVNILNRIPIQWMMVLFYVLILLIVVGSLAYFFKDILSVLNPQIPLSQIVSRPVLGDIIRAIGLAAVGTLLALLLMHIHLDSFIKQLNETIKESLVERKLDVNFEEFYQGKTFESIGSNFAALFNLLRSLDNMKSSRISLESNSLKILTNNIPEGVAIINKEKIVTQVNHAAEKMLRLIPGEIIGQSISRKISSPLIMESLDLCLNEDKKIVNERLELKESQVLNLNIFPVKNKFGETVRAVMVLTEKKNGI